MAKQAFALEGGGPKRLVLSWSGIWKHLQVTLDGALVGSFATKKELEAGRGFALPDGSELHVQLKREGTAMELQVRRNGAPLPGSASDPAQRVAVAAGVIYFVAALNAGLGLIAALGQVEFLLNIGLGYGAVGMGIFYAALGYLVKTKHSRIALVLAIIVFALDGLASFFMQVQPGSSPPVGGMVARIFLLLPMWKGLAALGELRKQPGPLSSSAS